MATSFYLTLENGHRKPEPPFPGHISGAELFEGQEPRFPFAVRFLQTCRPLQRLLLFGGGQTTWNKAINTHLSLLFFCSLPQTNIIGIQCHLNRDPGKEIEDFKITQHQRAAPSE